MRQLTLCVPCLFLLQIASLPHVELEFVVPTTGKRHKSLFLLDTGAGGSEMMFHSRAAKELGLLVEGKVSIGKGR